MKLFTFRARMDDPTEGQKMLEGNASVGETDVIVAAFGKPDDGAPVGVGHRQIIDHGAFRTAFAELGTAPTLPLVLDHADVHVRGFPDSTKVLGRAENFREEDEDARFRGFWNLRTQIGRESFENAVFNPNGTPFSFRWMDDKVRSDPGDGFEHVTEFHGLREVSQLSVTAAQRSTGILMDTMAMRVDDEEERLLRAAPPRPTIEQIQTWTAEDQAWGAALRTAFGLEVAPPAEPTVLSGRDILDKVAVEEMKKQLNEELRHDPTARELLRTILEEADKAEAGAKAAMDWLTRVWSARIPA